MANNPLDKVYLSEQQLDTLAGGGSISSGSDTYTADENTLYLIPDNAINIENGEASGSLVQITAVSNFVIADYPKSSISTLIPSSLSGGTPTMTVSDGEMSCDTPNSLFGCYLIPNAEVPQETDFSVSVDVSSINAKNVGFVLGTFESDGSNTKHVMFDWRPGDIYVCRYDSWNGEGVISTNLSRTAPATMTLQRLNGVYSLTCQNGLNQTATFDLTGIHPSWSSTPYNFIDTIGTVGDIKIGLSCSYGNGKAVFDNFNLIVDNSKSTADYKDSIAFGVWNNTNRESQVLLGSYSTPTQDTIFAIGNGVSDTDRSNAFEILADGSAKIGDAVVVSNTDDNKQVNIVSTNSNSYGNQTTFISSDACQIGLPNAGEQGGPEKNGREAIIASKSSSTDANDTAIVASRSASIVSQTGEHATESAILGGNGNIVKEQNSVAIGGNTNTIDRFGSAGSASAANAVALGGQSNVVSHLNSATVGGKGIKTATSEQVVVGRFNQTSGTDLFQVGMGSQDSSRSNAFSVSDTGDVSVAHTLTANYDILASHYLQSGSSLKVGKNILSGDLSNNTVSTNNSSNEHAAIIGGSGNNISGYSFNTGIIESKNSSINLNNGKDCSVILGGNGNTISGNAQYAAAVGGRSLIVSRERQVVTGGYNIQNDAALFIIGDGADTNNRANAFEVLYDGRTRVYGAPQGNNDVIRKQELDTGLATKQDVLTFDNAPTENSNNPVKSGGIYTAIQNAISSVYRYKGSVATYSDLPSTGLTVGDVYNVEDTGDNYAWTGTDWDKLSGIVDLSGYVPTSRTIAGNALTADITAVTLFNSLFTVTDVTVDED